MYDGTYIAPDDDQEALKWYLKAVEAGYQGAATRLAYLYDEIYDADHSARYYLEALTKDNEYLIQDLKHFSSFTIVAVKKKLRERGLFKGRITDAFDRKTEKALQKYVQLQVKSQ